MTAGIYTGAAHFTFSDTGALVYATGGDLGERTLVWVDRDGREETLAAEPRAYRYPRISPDGSRLAVDVRDQEEDIWIWDFARETLTRLTFAPGRDSFPVWTPDGRQVAFASNRDEPGFNLYWKAADGTGAVERLTESENGQRPYAFTPDGRQLVFLEIDEELRRNLGALSLKGSPEPLLATEFDERNAEISPDGRWLAYQSNASGQHEIYVRPFPKIEDGQWLISRGGGMAPLWSPDGRELFYVAPGTRLMAVGVQTEPSFAPGNAEEVFAGGVQRDGGRRTHLRHLSRWRAFPDDQGKRERRNFLDGVHPRPELVRGAEATRPHRPLRKCWLHVGCDQYWAHWTEIEK